MRNHILFILVSLVLAMPVAAQTTEFTYQGKLNDGANPANATYDFQFRLYDAASGGTLIGPTLTRSGVAVAAGVFSVNLDFGVVFPSGTCYLEIGIQPFGSSGYITLVPRQQISNTPYAFRSSISTTATNAATATNALQLGGVAASDYVQTGDVRLSNARNPLPGSTNYIQNSEEWLPGNFNIFGNGTANRFDAKVYYISGQQALSSDFYANVYVGKGAGVSTTLATFNTIAGYYAGNSNVSSNNAFFGAESGRENTTGDVNSFFGTAAGKANTVGSDNAFVGTSAGLNNTLGNQNTFIGRSAGRTNTSGSSNAFFGYSAGNTNTTGNNNTILGHNADVASGAMTYATAIGAGAVVSNNNSVVLGRPGGEDSVRVPGNLRITGGSDAEPATGGYLIAGTTTSTNVVIDDNEIMARDAGGTATLALNADGGHVNLIQGGTGNVGIGTATPADKLHVDGIIRVGTLGPGGAIGLCRNASNQIATCSSSLRYKTNFGSFRSGLDLVNRLKPITFDWREGGMHDLGLGAEDVAAIEPLLVTYNAKGEVEGVKYDRIGVVLVNAIKEQQAQIGEQKKELAEQRSLIAELKAVVCAANATASLCKPDTVSKP